METVSVVFPDFIDDLFRPVPELVQTPVHYSRLAKVPTKHHHGPRIDNRAERHGPVKTESPLVVGILDQGGEKNLRHKCLQFLRSIVYVSYYRHRTCTSCRPLYVPPRHIPQRPSPEGRRSGIRVRSSYTRMPSILSWAFFT